MLPHQQYQRIGISAVQIGTRSFISGINLFPSRLVGYHIPDSEKWIEIPPTSHVKALGVVFCSGELTGIKFIFTNSDSGWVGDSTGWLGHSNGPGIAQGMLSVPDRLDRT